MAEEERDRPKTTHRILTAAGIALLVGLVLVTVILRSGRNDAERIVDTERAVEAAPESESPSKPEPEPEPDADSDTGPAVAVLPSKETAVPSDEDAGGAPEGDGPQGDGELPEARSAIRTEEIRAFAAAMVRPLPSEGIPDRPAEVPPAKPQRPETPKPELPAAAVIPAPPEEPELPAAVTPEPPEELEDSAPVGIPEPPARFEPPDRPEIPAVPESPAGALTDGDLVILSPENRSLYSSVVHVAGKAPGFTELRWYSAATGAEGAVVPTDDGFAFSVSTEGYREDLDIGVAGVDSDGVERRVALELVNDGIGPSILLENPKPGDYYMDSVTVVGRVGPGPYDPPGIGEIESLSWVLDGGEPRSVIFDADGAFSFRIGMAGREERAELELMAADLNGNITRTSIPLLDGRLTPSLVLESPLPDSEYGAGFFLRGSVGDPYEGAGRFAGIESARYEMRSAEDRTRDGVMTGEIAVNPDGTFDIPLLTGSMRGLQELSIVVTGRNGRETIRHIPLRQGRSAIPSFEVQSDDASVRTRWDPVPTATGYEVVVQGPNDSVVRHVVGGTDVVLPGLTNGVEYGFHVVARRPTGSVESHELHSIPLGDRTLKPRVSGEFRRIRIGWTEIPGSDAYAVFRSDTPDGPFRMLRTDIAGDEFLDTDVDFGKRYWYAVAPAAYSRRMSSPSSGESLATQGSNVEQVARLDTLRPDSIFIEGDYAFIASGDTGLALVDIAEPARPVSAGLCELPGAEDVAVHGSYAYVASGSAGLKVVNIDDPSRPLAVGSKLAGDVGAVAVRDHYAFLADRDKGLRILDVTDSRDPVRLFATEGLSGLAVLLWDRFAFLAAGEDGVLVYDITIPSRPRQATRIPFQGAESMIRKDTLLIVGGRDSGLAVYDLSVAGIPRELSRIAGVEVLQLESSEEFLLISTPSELLLVDLRDPADPYLFQSYPVDGSAAMAVRGDNLLIAANDGLNLYQTYLVGSSFVTDEIALTGRSYGIRLSSDRLLISSHGGGLSLVSPGTLAVDAIHPTEFAEAAATGRSHLFVADGPAGIRAIRIDGTGEVVFEGNGSAHDITVIDRAVYAATDRGLAVLSEAPEGVSSPGTLPMSGCRSITSNGRFLVAGTDRALITLLPVDGVLPVETARIPYDGIGTIAVNGDLAAAAGRNGIGLFRIDDAGVPKLIGELPLDGAESVALDDRYLYVSAGYRGLLVYDIRRPESPKLVSKCAEVFAVEAVVDGDVAYVVDGDDLVRVRLFIPEWLR